MFGNKNAPSTNNRNERSLSPFTYGLSPFSSLRDDILDIFDSFGTTTPLSNEFIPRIEIKEKSDAYLLSAEIPGMSEKDMNVSIKDNCLILEGEKKEEYKDEKDGSYRSEFSYGSFYRAIPLSSDIDPEKVAASYKNGVLKIKVDKRPEAQKNLKKIPIAVEGKSDTKH